MSGQLRNPAVLHSGEDPQYSLNRRLGGPHSRSGHNGEDKNSLHLLWIELRSSRPQPSDYGVSKSFRTSLLERELQMVQLFATKCSCIAVLRVSVASFAAITLCVASQRVFVVDVNFVTSPETFGYTLVYWLNYPGFSIYEAETVWT
jgi:hypothetical protein